MIELNKSDKAYTCIDNIVPIIQFNKSDKIILITYLDWTDKLGRLEDFKQNVGVAVYLIQSLLENAL